jgi:hypothetical protein
MIHEEQLIYWFEPNGAWESTKITITVKEAIERQKDIARFKNFDYSTDAEALADFMSNRWASYIK